MDPMDPAYYIVVDQYGQIVVFQHYDVTGQVDYIEKYCMYRASFTKDVTGSPDGWWILSPGGITVHAGGSDYVTDSNTLLVARIRQFTVDSPVYSCAFWGEMPADRLRPLQWMLGYPQYVAWFQDSGFSYIFYENP